MTDKKKGTLYMIVAALGFALMASCVRMVGHDISVYQKLFFRNLISAGVILTGLLKVGGSLKPQTKKGFQLLMARSIVGVIGAIFYFYAITNLPLSDSTMLNKLSPFFVFIFACVFLKEKFFKVQLLPIILVFLGALLVIKPSFNLSVVPALIGFCSAIFAGAAYTLIRKLKDYENPNVISFFFPVFCIIVIFPMMVISGYVQPNFKQWVFLIGSGIFATLGQVCMTYSYKYAQANEVSIYQYLSILFSTLIGIIFIGEIPDIYSFLGGVFIVGAAILNYYISNKVIKK